MAPRKMRNTKWFYFCIRLGFAMFSFSYCCCTAICNAKIAWLQSFFGPFRPFSFSLNSLLLSMLLLLLFFSGQYLRSAYIYVRVIKSVCSILQSIFVFLFLFFIHRIWMYSCFCFFCTVYDFLFRCREFERINSWQFCLWAFHISLYMSFFACSFN